MDRTIDWIGLWRELVEVHVGSWSARFTEEGGEEKADRAIARSFDARVKDRSKKRDSSRLAVRDALRAHPGSTLLDIGAGSGAWVCFLARHARYITAVDSSAAMLDLMQEKLAAEGIDNVRSLQGVWPDVAVEPHDFSLCSHAMYGSPDLPAFVQRMMAVTRRTCFLVMRAPTPDGVMAEAARHIWGHPHDSPNFQVAYNALLQMGLFPNVLMEDSGLWPPRTNESLEEALSKVKRRLGLIDTTEHDDFLMDLLRRRLTWQDGKYVWPAGIRSALIYWNVE